ncbi:uncharacterized mitochondrial protein AtMg00810-like [Vicia villosa]|uniref:uncharacterized mitochondrial protein AtMg00810-like n=1 Tax=Vicia villosa TaxID=3911 RepID=UPI00273B6873|nr:uncharacterized mitochondrial protein AtMg00810-like [Vicia villosa]
MSQPPGFVKKNQEGMVYRLHKALYGLKQAPKAWNLKIDSFFKLQGFRKCEMEYGVYVQYTSKGNMILVCLYVDDIVLIGSCSDEIVKFKKVLMNEFEMTDLGNMVYLLGKEIMYSEKGIILQQLKYELELLKRFELTNCKTAITPAETNHKLDFDVESDDVDATTFKELVGKLRYLCNTRPDIFYAVGMVIRFMNKPKWSHYQATVRILRYIKGTLRYGVLFPSDVKSDSELICYSDSDWCGDRVDRRSTSRYFSKYLESLICWCSKKQPMNLKIKVSMPMSTQKQLADVLTKAVKIEHFIHLRDEIGVV